MPGSPSGHAQCAHRDCPSWNGIFWENQFKSVLASSYRSNISRGLARLATCERLLTIVSTRRAPWLHVRWMVARELSDYGNRYQFGSRSTHHRTVFSKWKNGERSDASHRALVASAAGITRSDGNQSGL